MENPFKKYFRERDGDEKDQNRDKSHFFKKFEEENDDDDFFDLDELFSELHGNTFKFQGFPPGVMQQFQDILEAMKELDDDPTTQRQKTFESKCNELRQNTDKDLDGQLYADQLDTLLKRVSPEYQLKSPVPTVKPPINQKKIKMPDEDKIMDIIHGTFKEEVEPVRPRKRQVQKVPASPSHFGGIPSYDMPNSSRQTWSKSVVQIFNADGTTETRNTERTAGGEKKTVITKTFPNGGRQTQTFIGDGPFPSLDGAPGTRQPSKQEYAERNLVAFEGYKIPSLW